MKVVNVIFVTVDSNSTSVLFSKELLVYDNIISILLDVTHGVHGSLFFSRVLFTFTFVPNHTVTE